VKTVCRGGHAHFLQVFGGDVGEFIVGEGRDGCEVLGLVFVGFVAEVDEFFFEGGEDGGECLD
jgi:hypothetical protein